MSKKGSQQFVLIAKDDSRETREKIEIIRILMRKMALDNGQNLEERCLTIEEYQEELEAEKQENKQKQTNEKATKE